MNNNSLRDELDIDPWIQNITEQLPTYIEKWVSGLPEQPTTATAFMQGYMTGTDLMAQLLIKKFELYLKQREPNEYSFQSDTITMLH